MNNKQAFRIARALGKIQNAYDRLNFDKTIPMTKIQMNRKTRVLQNNITKLRYELDALFVSEIKDGEPQYIMCYQGNEFDKQRTFVKRSHD